MEWFKTVLDMANNITDLTEKLKTRDKTQILRRKMETLAAREADIRTQLNTEEKRPRKKRKEEVNVWLKNFVRLRDEVDGVVQNVTTLTSCWQLILGSSLDKLIREAEQLHEQWGFPEGLTLDVEKTRGYEVPVEKLVGKNFQSNLGKIWDYLTGEEVQHIGVQGMGGVGKTTIVKHIHNQIVKDHVTFESSCWVTVSQDCSVWKLQDAIAKHLCLDLENENDEMIRAGRLCDALKMRLVSRKFIIILDDVWEYYPLEKVGIPLARNGCKLILTSRKKDVCHQMNCDKIVEIVTLPEQEAWYLFQANLGYGTLLSQEVEKIAQAVARECAGLPLGIVVLSGIMRGVNDIHEWCNTLNELKESKFTAPRMEEEVFAILQFSYERLGNRVLQQCFSHISLYPEDAEVNREEVIQYFIDFGLIERGGTRKANFDKGNAILNTLVKSCLLEERSGCVKMHDLVRDMVIKVKNKHFIVKVGQQLREIPDGIEWVESLEKVSLMKNEIKQISQGTSPRCPNISTLFLQKNPLVSSCGSFFRYMSTLQILNLSSTEVEVLPKSFSNLENLIALHLNDCYKLRYVPSLERMRALRTLNLCGSGIEELPLGMERLRSLVHLNLSSLKRLNIREWPTGILPQLSHLQYLNFLEGPQIMKAEELLSLKKLEDLGCSVSNVDEFSICMSYLSEIPHANHWRITSRDNRLHFAPRSRLVFSRKGNATTARIACYNMEGRHKPLPNDAVELLLAYCKGITSLRQLGATFPELKECKIAHCDGMETLINDSQQCTPFPKLESLTLEHVRDLRLLIAHSVQPIMTPDINNNFFSSLTSLRICSCPRIKKLLTPALLPLLRHVEKITVKDCEELEEVIALENDDHDDPNLDLPKLCYLYLDSLPQLKSICGTKWTMKCDSLKTIFMEECPRLERIPIELRIPEDGNKEEDPIPSSLESVTIRSIGGRRNRRWGKW